MKYADWRRRLTFLQEELQMFDEEFDGVIEHDEYMTMRRPLEEKLEAHYALESETTD